MSINTITKRLIKIAGVLENKKLSKKAEVIRRICADIAKFLPMYESENDQKIILEKEIKGIPGVSQVRSRLNPVHDAVYYDIAFENGIKASLNQALFGPLRTVSKETEKRPYILKIEDPSGKKFSGGKSLSKQELFSMLKKVGEGSKKEIEMLSKERY